MERGCPTWGGGSHRPGTEQAPQSASLFAFGLLEAGGSLRRHNPGKGLLDQGSAVRTEPWGERVGAMGGEAIETFASALFMT